MDEKRCKKSVYPNEQWGAFHPHQCHHLIWKDGYCKQHHPEIEEKRQKDRKAKWDAEREARHAKWDEEKRKWELVEYIKEAIKTNYVCTDPNCGACKILDGIEKKLEGGKDENT